MLIHFEDKGPSSGFQREGPRCFEAESQLAFDRLTLYAPGWALHDAKVGGKLLMFSWELGAIVTRPLTFQINGSPAEKIVLDLRLVELSAPAPYVMVRPMKAKPFEPFGGKLRRRGVRLVFDE